MSLGLDDFLSERAEDKNEYVDMSNEPAVLNGFYCHNRCVISE